MLAKEKGIERCILPAVKTGVVATSQGTQAPWQPGGSSLELPEGTQPRQHLEFHSIRPISDF